MAQLQTSLSKVTFGNNIPGWATAISNKPAVIVLQVKFLPSLVTSNQLRGVKYQGNAYELLWI